VNREQAINAALVELKKIGVELKSRVPSQVEENARLIQGKNSRGWSFVFDLIVPAEFEEHGMMMVEVYEPSGEVIVYPTI
jgi:hypothetical protein